MHNLINMFLCVVSYTFKKRRIAVSMTCRIFVPLSLYFLVWQHKRKSHVRFRG